jgi:CHAD domain-containing protein
VKPAPRFRLSSRETTARALARLGREQVEHALVHARRGDARGVHEARKACKRLRAVLRLMRSALGEGYRAQNRRVRDAARALASSRDADVLQATARSLRLGLTTGVAARRGRERPASQHAIVLLQAQRQAVLRWPLDAPSRAGLEQAIARGYRRARRAGRHARRKPGSATLHEWRKQVKYHRFQCEAATTLWPSLHRRVAALDDLGETLGRHHDLELLAAALQRQPQRFGAPDMVLRGVRRLLKEQDRLAARALRAGARLFRDDPRGWLAREARR